MAHQTIYWTVPKIQPCYNSSIPNASTCFGAGKCDLTDGFCHCSHKYGDRVSYCEYSFFDVYSSGALSHPIIGTVLTAIILVFFFLELGVDLRLRKFKMMKTPIGVAKILMIPYLLLQIGDFVIFWEDFNRSHPSDEIYESVVDAVGQALVFFIITMLAVGWFGMLLRSKRLDKAFPIRKTRIALIVIFCIYAPTWTIVSVLEGIGLLSDAADIAAAVYIFLFSLIMGWLIVSLTKWLHAEAHASKSEKYAKIALKNKFLIGAVLSFLGLAINILIGFGVPGSFLPYVKLIMKSVDEILFLLLALFLFLFSQNYLFAAGFLRGYVFVAEIPDSFFSSTASTRTKGTGARKTQNSAKTSSVASRRSSLSSASTDRATASTEPQ